MVRLGNKGFTLIELVIFIVIGGIFIPTSMVAFTAVMSNFSTPDYQVTARFLAEQKMEEVTSQAFDNLTCLIGTSNLNTYTDSIGEYSRLCQINYVQYNSSTNSIEDTASSTNYKKVRVLITPPGGVVFDVGTVVSKRPR